jgi:hypothetical protein
MNVVQVAELLANHGNRGDALRMRRLTALDPRPDPYFALLCQPDGTIHASAARIGNSDGRGVLPMYRAFLNHAVDSQAQLAITPEYSMPWALVREILAGAARPPLGSLWVLGCESITPAELDALQLELEINGNSGVRLIHEPFDPQRKAQKVFVDPIVFVFWAVDGASADVLCLLVQFKTVVSRDPDHAELQSLYLGTDVYKFTAHAGDVSLLALICSDAFEFTDALVNEHCNDLLLVHVQLNQRPGYVDYSAYRSRLFSVASNNNIEVVCLNWAADVLVEGGASPWNSIAGSAWYIAPRGVTTVDADVNQLHHDGMYYSVVGERWQAFYLNYGPHTLLLRKQAVFARGPQVLAPRIAPQVVERRVWSAKGAAWTAVKADDGFGTFIQAYAALRKTLPQMCEQDPLAVERALELLEGPLGNVDEWYTLRELNALKVADEESIRLVTVSQETDARRRGVAFRRERARCAQAAVTIPGQAVTWPTPVVDLAAGFRYRWAIADPHSNVEPVAGGKPAAFVFLGDDPEADTLANIYAKISKARKVHACIASVKAGLDPSDAASQAEDRLCVVYRQNHALQFYRPAGYASITDPAGAHVDDIGGAQ